MLKNIKKIVFSPLLGAALLLFGQILFLPNREIVADKLVLEEQEATVRAVKKVSASVVNILVYYPAKKTSWELSVDSNNSSSTSKSFSVTDSNALVSSGTGFLISSDGLIITNKHVIKTEDEKKAVYRVVMSSGKKYYAQFIGKDPINDLAVLKIFDKNLPSAELGDSSSLEPGMSVMAIGNSLGVYQNTVTKGIVSALKRNILANDDNGAESLNNVIQTDANINIGNSGGPLIDLNGRVVGINVATDNSGFSIGFAIPINDVKPVIRSVKEIGRIVRPRIGLRYLTIDKIMQEEKKLSRSNGALISSSGDGGSGIISSSPASRADLREGDIIFEVNKIKLDDKNELLAVVQNYKPGDKLVFKIQRGKDVLERTVELDEFK